MVEFLFLVFPLVLLFGSTVSISWLALAKSQLRIIAAEAVFQAAQPDSEEGEVRTTINTSAAKKLGAQVQDLNISYLNDLVTVELSYAPSMQFGFAGIFSPHLRVTSHGALEL